MLRKTSKGFYTLTALSNFKNLAHGFSTKDLGDVRFKIAGTKKNPENQVVGAVHAGWRGTVAGVAKNLIKKFVNDFKSDPGKLLVGFGPCIEFCHYSVTTDRASKIKKAGLGESLLTS